MTINEAINHFGSATALAKALKIKKSAVSQWRKTGKIPPLRQYQLQEVTNGKLQMNGNRSHPSRT